MIRFNQKGDLSKATRFLEKAKNFKIGVLEKYGRMGVEALSANTPVDTGVTASSWFYKITENGKSTSIEFHNSNINKGVSIALILQYGHGTGTGGWVEGRDYINPAIQPIFDQLANNAWKEAMDE